MQLVFNTKANLSQPCLSSLYATTIVAKQLTSFCKDDQSLQPQDMQYFTNWNFPSILILEVKQRQVEELLINLCSPYIWLLPCIAIHNHFLLSELPKRNLKEWKGTRIQILQREDQRKHPNSMWSLEERNKNQLLVQNTMWTLYDCASLPEPIVTSLMYSCATSNT